MTRPRCPMILAMHEPGKASLRRCGLLAGTISGTRMGDKGIITRYLKVCDDPICMMSSSCNSTHVSGGTVVSVSMRCTRVREAKGKGIGGCLIMNFSIPRARTGIQAVLPRRGQRASSHALTMQTRGSKWSRLCELTPTPTISSRSSSLRRPSMPPSVCLSSPTHNCTWCLASSTSQSLVGAEECHSCPLLSLDG